MVVGTRLLRRKAKKRMGARPLKVVGVAGMGILALAGFAVFGKAVRRRDDAASLLAGSSH
jgi:hypothetical protein